MLLSKERTYFSTVTLSHKNYVAALDSCFTRYNENMRHSYVEETIGARIVEDTNKLFIGLSLNTNNTIDRRIRSNMVRTLIECLNLSNHVIISVGDLEVSIMINEVVEVL